MKSRAKMLKATKWTGGLIMLVRNYYFYLWFCKRFQPNYRNWNRNGYGGIFISLIGMFFVATEEMIENYFKGSSDYNTF